MYNIIRKFLNFDSLKLFLISWDQGSTLENYIEENDGL